MKWILFMYWAMTVNPKVDFIRSNMLAAKISEAVFGVPASVQFSQAIWESGGGRSYIAQNSNNYFGIKYYPEEFCGGYFTDRTGQRWRAYPIALIGWLDHAHFINKHYSGACWGDYRRFAALSGYGGSKYWKMIVNTIERQNLHKYDKY